MKIGLIGCGSIAQVHAKIISAMGDGRRLAAVADCDADRAAGMAREYGAVPYRDWEEMLQKETLDAVHICTPHYLHTPMAAAVLQKGIHVFTEKPPVISREQLECLKAAVREAEGRARLAVCFQNRFNPNVQYVKKLLREGSLGRLKGARAFVTWHRDAAYYTESSWRGKLETEGGGALINQGIHTLDLIQYLTGDTPVRVDAAQGNFHLKDEIEVEDTLAAYVQYPESRAVFYATTAYAEDAPPLIDLQCERGHVRIEGDELLIRREDGSRERIPFSAEEGLGKSYWGAGHKAAIEGFYESIAEGKPYLLDFDRVEETIELTLRIYDAARTGACGRAK